MMHQGLDLSRFKKVSSDKKTTTLRHAKGHEIHIAHSGLTPKMKEQLDCLPHYDEGGKVGRFVDDDAAVNDGAAGQPMDPSSPAQTNDTAPMPVEATPSAPDPDTQAADQPNPEMTGAAPQSQAAPAATLAPPDMANQLKTQDALTQDDLAKGHIKPETYQSLFAKKDTLGKIGTLFGMLLSGAGSGLAHQPNAVMDMMKNQINNDFEAQKASSTNAQNFLRLQQQHAMNEAQIGQMGIQNELTKAETGAVPSKIALTKAQIRETNIKSDAAARMLQNRVALHSLVVETQKMPEGPAKQQMMQTLGLMSQGIQTENYDIADRAAAMGALSNALNPEPAAGTNPEGQFRNTQNQLRYSGMDKIAEDREGKHFPGLQGQASIPLTPSDRSQINSGIGFQDQLQRFVDWTKKHSGDLNPKEKLEGEALASQLQGSYRQATNGGVYKEGEQGFISKVIDSEPTKFFNSIRVLPKLTAVQKESSAQLNQLLKSKGYTQGYKPEAIAEEKKAGPKEGTTGTYNGQSVVFSGGKWKRK